ncbi:YlxQ family RNA-binding protein [Neobacillus thermocopriae]|uniref:YlxQ family RNA-binding protein n=1 Tax=Neobacillus thermocopriae TaxID=1215031 RepID=A0A6B3TM63_9BACI|nr:YlxQ family RNA-binding protein [Neobacillus thermocopriae]MED3624223.1 YlxQ family RNA-binding protein [Neobacillus thermocopriae]MED3713582.1 YlxQ family RNA-binding protein [Neobacillus thermocopriae]NEX77692.1 YlxQ family RNA-binding protein [Neobacillus thermocopriae]
MKENRWMSLLGLANRARQITSGEELTVKQIQRGNAKLVLLSADASRNTTKKITDKCNSYEVPLKVVENRYILGQAIGKDARVVVAVLDDGFAKKLVTLLD